MSTEKPNRTGNQLIATDVQGSIPRTLRSTPVILKEIHEELHSRGCIPEKLISCFRTIYNNKNIADGATALVVGLPERDGALGDAIVFLAYVVGERVVLERFHFLGYKHVRIDLSERSMRENVLEVACDMMRV